MLLFSFVQKKKRGNSTFSKPTDSRFLCGRVEKLRQSKTGKKDSPFLKFITRCDASTLTNTISLAKNS